MSKPHELSTVRQPAPESGWSVAAWRRFERGGDRVFGIAANPLRQLGAVGFLLFWLVAASGIYLYVFFDTSLDGAWVSIDRLTYEQWWAGGVMRSVHRYASDALVVVVSAHLVRELMLKRFFGFRWYSWVSGVPTIWLISASGVVGYWLVWDEVAQFVGVALTEWFGALPGFGPSLVRNFVGEYAMNDRLFSLLVFLHIGVSLFLLLAMWAHVQRLTQPETTPTRPVTLGTVGALLAASLAWPALSAPPADLATVPARLPIDWFYLAPFPAMYASSPELVWAVLLGATLLVTVAPWLVRRPRPAPARVDPEHCNGCTRCFADCPYAAVVMAPHPSGRGQIAVVSEDLCASCGICAGSCPTATPFRSSDRLDTGIDLPDLTVEVLREQLSQRLGAAVRACGTGRPTVLFRCGEAAQAPVADDVVTLDLVCAGMLPPPFVDFALRNGAGSVVVASCPPGDCGYRFGARWTGARLDRTREPRLRSAVDPKAVHLAYASREDHDALAAVVDEARAALKRSEQR